MAKFKIELDLDWLNENESLDDILKSKILAGLTSKVTEKAKKEIDFQLAKIVEQEAKKVVDIFLSKTLDNTMENIKIPMTQDWNYEVKYVSLSEFVGKKYEEHLTKKTFDANGSIPNYDRDKKLSIIEYFTENYLEKHLTKKVISLIENAKKEAEETIIKTMEQNLKEQLSLDIIKRLNIPEMLKVLQEKALLVEKKV